MQHIFEFLWERYRAMLTKEVAKRNQKEGREVANLAEVLARAPATDLVKYAERYLTTYPVVQTFPLDANVGVRLANGVEVSIGPDVHVSGSLQDSTSIPIISEHSNERSREERSIPL